jgi:DNA-binding GntR family transcriptional regulator
MRDAADATPSIDDLGDLHDAIFALLRPDDPSGIPTAVDHAYDMIWRQLIKGERQPGERLTDTELAAQLGLSRTPVRQALHRLAQEELVRLDARRGFSVRVFSAQDVREIYDVRRSLEVLALRLAAPRLSPDDLQEQLRRLYAVRDALRTRADRSAHVLHLQADLTFHNLLIRTAGNGRLLRILAALRSQQALFQYWDISFPQASETAGEEHERILLALIAGETDQAAALMAQHITNSRNRVLRDLFDLAEAATRSANDGADPEGLNSSGVARTRERKGEETANVELST